MQYLHISARSRVEHCQKLFDPFSPSSAQPDSAMAKLILFIVVVVALAMTKTPTFSLPHSKVAPQPLPKWEQIDGKLHALAAEKQVTRKQTLKEFLMGEVPKIVTYEVHKVDEGFTAEVQVGDLHFQAARAAASEEDAKRSAAVAALWELQWQPTPKPSPKRLPNDRKRLRGHFQFLPPHEHIKQVMTDEILQSLRKTRAKVKLLGLDERNNQNDLLLHLSGREDRFMKAVHKVNVIVNNIPKRLRPKVALHMDH